MSRDRHPPDGFAVDLHPRVAAALARLEADDRHLAEEADAAWRWLAGDAPPDAPSQHQLQNFLWHALPRKWDCDLAGQLVAADALARLFDLLDAPRYAELCRSPETRDVLAAYDRDEAAGFDACRRALDRSGIDPPDTPELTWGGLMSVDEARAREYVAARLEAAVRDGRFRPGRRGWRAAQRAAAAEALHESVPAHPGGQTWLQTVVTARCKGWVERYEPSPRRWRLVSSLESALLHPVPMPEEATEIVAPLRWLLERAVGDGLALTERGNLSRPLVVEACQRFGWAPLGRGRKVQREEDIIELLVWDELVREAGLVRRRGRRLVATPAGRQAAAGDEPTWRALAKAFVDRDGWEGFVRETVLLLLLDAPGDGLPRARMLTDLVGLAREAGWRDQGTGEPPDERAVSRTASPPVYHLQLMGLVEQRHETDVGGKARLLPVGRATATEAIRARATAPRVNLLG